MALQYRLYQMTNSRSGANGKWFARATMMDTVNTNTLAEQIEANCSVKRSDVLAVISELVVVMTQALQDSKRVKLDNFGSFKLGMKTTGAQTAKDFTPSVNVKDVHVLFQPEVRIGSDGRRSKTLVDGCRVSELPENSVDKSATSTVAGA